MAVVGSAQERPDSPQAVFDLESASITRKFLVTTDSVTTGPVEVVNAPGIPTLFSPYVFGSEYNLYARVRKATPERVEPGSLYWIVTIEYTTPAPLSGSGGGSGSAGRGTVLEKDGQADNPLLEIPTVEITCETEKIVVYGVFDSVTGNLAPCKASNGEIFDPAPMKDSSRFTLSISRNEFLLAPHPATAILYTDTVNSDTFWGSPAGCAKVRSITASRETKQLSTGGILPYLKVKYIFDFKPTWDTYILDSGSWYTQSVGMETKKMKFLTDDNHPRQGLLDGTGRKLADGADPVFRAYRFYTRVPFAPLNLPGSFAQLV